MTPLSAARMIERVRASRDMVDSYRPPNSPSAQAPADGSPPSIRFIDYDTEPHRDDTPAEQKTASESEKRRRANTPADPAAPVQSTPQPAPTSATPQQVVPAEGTATTTSSAPAADERPTPTTAAPTPAHMAGIDAGWTPLYPFLQREDTTVTPAPAPAPLPGTPAVPSPGRQGVDHTVIGTLLVDAPTTSAPRIDPVAPDPLTSLVPGAAIPADTTVPPAPDSVLGIIDRTRTPRIDPNAPDPLTSLVPRAAVPANDTPVPVPESVLGIIDRINTDRTASVSIPDLVLGPHRQSPEPVLYDTGFHPLGLIVAFTSHRDGLMEVPGGGWMNKTFTWTGSEFRTDYTLIEPGGPLHRWSVEGFDSAIPIPDGGYIRTMPLAQAQREATFQVNQAHEAMLARPGATPADYSKEFEHRRTLSMLQSLGNHPDDMVRVVFDSNDAIIAVSRIATNGRETARTLADVPDGLWVDPPQKNPELTLAGVANQLGHMAIGVFALTDIGAAINGVGSAFGQDWHLPTSDDVAAGIDTNIRAAKTEYNRDNIPGALNHTGMAIGFPDWRDPNAVVAFGLVALAARSVSAPRGTLNPLSPRGDQPHVSAIDGNAERTISPDTQSKPQQPNSHHSHRGTAAERPSEGHRAGESTEYAALNDKDYALVVGADSVIEKGKINPKDIYGDLPLNHPGRYRLAKVVTDTRFSQKDTGMSENAMAFALETGGRNNPFRFADHYEYVHAKYQQFKRSLTGTDWTREYKEADKQVPGVRQHAGKMFGKQMGALERALEQDRLTVENSRWKARATDPSLRGDALDVAVRALRDLGFSDAVGAFYHALKHQKELPAYELAENSLIDAYHDSAGRTIREADRVRIRPDGDLIALIYYRRVSDGVTEWNMEAIVKVHPDGTVRIASYGKAKVVEK